MCVLERAPSVGLGTGFSMAKMHMLGTTGSKVQRTKLEAELDEIPATKVSASGPLLFGQLSSPFLALEALILCQRDKETSTVF